jgi:nucleoid DNA-binding protein
MPISVNASKSKKMTAIRESYTKAKLLAAISEETGLPRKQVTAVFESLQDIMHRHLKKRAVGTFTLPGLAKFTVVQKKATKARKGMNPATREEIMISAKPARRVVRVRALKGAKEMATT